MLNDGSVLNVCIGKAVSSRRTFIFRRRRSERRARYLRNAFPLCKLLSIRERFFLFYILHPWTSPPRCYRKPLNSWSFCGRGQKGSGGQALSRMHKRGNRAGARCKFITRVCRAFVRVRLFVKSNQILSSAHSRRFYKSSIAEVGRDVAMWPAVRTLLL